LARLGNEVVGVVLAVMEPRAEAVFAARVEERRVAPPLEGAHRLIDHYGSQRRDVLFEGAD
jgi:hypothetical protein